MTVRQLQQQRVVVENRIQIRTLIVVAHGLSTVVTGDCILVLKEGDIVE